MKFLFKRPKHVTFLSEKANLAIAMGALACRLSLELRTRTVHPDGRRENVAEHSLMLVKVATSLAQQYYPQLDSGKVAIYASLHDDVEAYVGDSPTDSLANHSPEAKKYRETTALKQLIKEYENIAPLFVKHHEEYEA